MSSLERQQGINAAQEARTELYRTLGQLKDRLNYAHRVDVAVGKAKRRLRQKLREDSVTVVATAVTAVTVVAAAAVGVAALLTRKK